MRMGGRPGAPRALAVPTGPLGSAGPPQTAKTIFSCILERLIENRLLERWVDAIGSVRIVSTEQSRGARVV